MFGFFALSLAEIYATFVLIFGVFSDFDNSLSLCVDIIYVLKQVFAKGQAYQSNGKCISDGSARQSITPRLNLTPWEFELGIFSND